jgi:hypothetical protein
LLVDLEQKSATLRPLSLREHFLDFRSELSFTGILIWRVAICLTAMRVFASRRTTRRAKPCPR